MKDLSVRRIQNAIFVFSPSEKTVLFSLVALKLIIHFSTNTRYGFHRDEFLYLDESRHLGWGFIEVPPLTPFLGRIALELGGSLFIVRFLPALIGALSIYFLLRMVKDLGGGSQAMFIAGITFVLSPAYLGSNTLFQPVSFNQFWWLLTAFLTVRLIRSGNHRYWYFLGIAAGLGWLTKYSIAFYALALTAGLILSPQRYWWRTAYPYLGLFIALLLVMPNIIWQWQHHWPVMGHMQELSESQLVNVDPVRFLGAQLRFHGGGLVVWLAGLYYLMRTSAGEYFRPLGIAWLFVILFLLLLSGKSYYSIGAYPPLMAAGGVAWAEWLKRQRRVWSFVLPVVILVFSLPLIPYNVPVMRLEKLEKYAGFMSNVFGYRGPLIWEDGEIHSIPQDFADMHGWEELARRTADTYHDLSEEEQMTCIIWGGGYAHAGAINHFRKKYDLPEAISLNSSYALWAPDILRFDRLILIDDVFQEQSSWFEYSELADSIRNPLARDPGYIYYRHTPRINVEAEWQELVRNIEYRR